jgi:hypothetical protein
MNIAVAARIKKGKVVNTEVVSSKSMDDPDLVVVTPATGNPVIGLGYANGVFERPPIPVPTLDDLKAEEAFIHQKIADLEARK